MESEQLNLDGDLQQITKEVQELTEGLQEEDKLS